MKKLVSLLLALAVLASLCVVVEAENPIVQTRFSPDPAPMVYNDVLYMYVGEDSIIDNGFYNMTGWYCYSTTDLVNWQDHGLLMLSEDFKWAEPGSAWAAQCVERDGKFYLYTTVTASNGGGRAIGVAVADSPTGPFKDALGEPLCGPNWSYIDPTVFIDDDGTAHLYFGNPQLHHVELNKDMISLKGEIERIPMTTEAFGERIGGDADHQTNYEEGPWFYKRNDLYYLVYAGCGVPENICYSTAPSPTGPWTYGGIILNNKNSTTIHPGIVDYKGKSYFFYHGGDLKGSSWNKRSACVEEFTYGEDGSIPLMVQSLGVKAIDTFDPYKLVEAETICWSDGLTTAKEEDTIFVTGIETGDYIKLKNVDFGEEGSAAFIAKIRARDKGRIDVRIDGMFGEQICTIEYKTSNDWQTVTAEAANITGTHDIFITFVSDAENALDFDCWEFKKAGEEIEFTVEKPANNNLIPIIAAAVIVGVVVAVAALTKGKKKKV